MPKQFVVVAADDAAIDPSQYVGTVELFNADGTAYTGGGDAPAAVTWTTIAGKPAVIAAGADAAAARTAIGAGTSSLIVGTGATNAKAGNAIQTAAQTTATAIAPGTATNVQGILAELAARIVLLEAETP